MVTKVTPKPKAHPCVFRLGRSAPSMHIRSPIYMQEASENGRTAQCWSKGGSMSNFTAAFLFTLSGLEASLVETDWSGI
jgi:hypothetical protein